MILWCMKCKERVTLYGGEIHKGFSWESLNSVKETQVWRPPGNAGVHVMTREKKRVQGK
jgi:hypothetical protein